MSNEPGRSLRLFILLLKLTADVLGSPCVPPDPIKLNKVTTVFWMEAKSLLWPSGHRLSFHRYMYHSATRYEQMQPLRQNYDLLLPCCNLQSVSHKSVCCIPANNAPINTLRSEDGCISLSIFTFVSMLIIVQHTKDSTLASMLRCKKVFKENLLWEITQQTNVSWALQ